LDRTLGQRAAVRALRYPPGSAASAGMSCPAVCSPPQKPTGSSPRPQRQTYQSIFSEIVRFRSSATTCPQFARNDMYRMMARYT
jgi:hypothetical protein